MHADTQNLTKVRQIQVVYPYLVVWLSLNMLWNYPCLFACFWFIKPMVWMKIFWESPSVYSSMVLAIPQSNCFVVSASPSGGNVFPSPAALGECLATPEGPASHICCSHAYPKATDIPPCSPIFPEHLRISPL